MNVVAERTRRSFGRCSLGKDDGGNQQLEHMLSGILGGAPQRLSRTSSNMRKIVHVLQKMDSPHEDALWREVYDNVSLSML